MNTGSTRFPVRFPVGAKAYAKDGRIYTIDEVTDGMVYCRGEGGTETEFPESALVNETEWAAQANGRRDLAYTRIKHSKAFTTPAGKFDRAAAERLLTQSDRVIPGLLDFIAFTAGAQVLAEQKDQAGADNLSIIKCRRVFDETTPEVRVTLLANVLSVQPDMLVSAAKLGDNMAKAMIDKGLETRAQAFEDFCDRPRK